MVLELILVTAFALFAVFAWLKITEVEKSAEFYRNQYGECLEEIRIREQCQRSDGEHTSRLWEEVDNRRIEVRDLERQLDQARAENGELSQRLAGYWLMTN